MRSWIVLAGILVIATACGDATGAVTTTLAPGTTSTSLAPVPTAPSTTSAPSTTVTTAPTSKMAWDVATLGTNPTVALGTEAALGSGCSPGSDILPDGVWFGWIAEVDSSSVAFDLACLWPGRTLPAVSNDSSNIRTVEVADGAVLYSDDGATPVDQWAGEPTTVSNAPGLPATLPYWLFVNDGVATEISRYPERVTWSLSTDAWPDDLYAGCCGTNDVAPPSPEAPLPDSGWPADGFYGAYLVDPSARLSPDQGYLIEISTLVACSDRPDLCLPDWTPGNVTSDPTAPTIERLVPFETSTTFVLQPIFSESALVGDGEAFAGLIEDMADALAPIGDPVENWLDLIEVVKAHRNDPTYPLGIPVSPESTDEWPIGFRGPGGAYLTVDPPWMMLEMRDGRPLLYVHVGMVAG